jgi:hypothetical protein
MSLAVDDIQQSRLAFVATALFASATFWLTHRLPMLDLPQHAAQVALLHDLLLGRSKWQSLVSVNYFTPYFAGYAPALLLSFAMPAAAALKVMLTVAYLGFIAACVALRHELGGDSRLDWLFIPSFFGIVFTIGLYTFMIAAPLGVLFIVLALRHARQPTLRMGLFLLIADLGLFFAHGLVFVFANVIGGVFLLLKSRGLVRLLRGTLPYVAVGLLCLVYIVVRLRFEFEYVPPDDTWPSFFWGLNDASRLGIPSQWAAWSKVDPRRTLFELLFVAMLMAPFLLGARPNWREPAAVVPFVLTLLIWLLLPRRIVATDELYRRFSLFILPGYAWMFHPVHGASSRVRRLWLPLLCWMFIAVHVHRLMIFAEDSASFEEVLAAAQPGERALGAVLDQSSGGIGAVSVYMHWPAWYQAERGGFVDFNFARYVPQIVRYRPDRMPLHFNREDWAQNPRIGFDWDRDGAGIYRYIFVRSAGPIPASFFPAGQCRPVLRKSLGSWSLFENVNCRTSSVSNR